MIWIVTMIDGMTLEAAGVYAVIMRLPLPAASKDEGTIVELVNSCALIVVGDSL
jgi:hypothetical protein